MGSSETKSQHGYRVIEVFEGSPAHEAKLQPFLDFIESVNGTNLRESEIPFQEIIKLNIDCEVTLSVYNLAADNIREVIVVPKQWKGEGALGITLRYEDIQQSRSKILHVTKVIDNQPAKLAGIIPLEDYILGSIDFDMQDIDTLEAYASMKPEVHLQVYSSSTKTVRMVTLKTGYPESEPRLGLEIAVGALHGLN
ncbi:unnamed protein product [Blepharisma stoltei]|uniref:PDZ GRASP-type domain-containing protein n=1 Tax=Blepharisma stoltei TaxID=1481888 RepID=A0AAU9K1C7_9CILI|nr:unnamed protein product [Blepharisma stoltei]